FLAGEISPDTYVNVMDQYYPTGRVSGSQFVEINRRISTAEFRGAIEAAQAAGLWRIDSRHSAV
ncbi:MAG TPA: hypothetical protein VGH38_11740, partial [Bryobacteraceae bacterium]